MDMPLHAGHRALRNGRAELRGQLHHVTMVTHDRRPLFRRFDAAAAACRVIHARTRAGELDALCWVLMPDHLHLLLRLQTDDLSAAVGELQARVARAVDDDRDPAPAVWGRGFHDHALRSDENPLVVARTLIANPLRAGLVPSLRFYPYWYVAWL